MQRKKQWLMQIPQIQQKISQMGLHFLCGAKEIELVPTREKLYKEPQLIKKCIIIQNILFYENCH